MSSSKDDFDPLVRSSVARQDWGGISSVTEWRWIKKRVIPAPIKINGRNYYKRSVVEKVKAGEAA